MEAPVLEAEKLRPEIIQRVEAMDDESLLLLHRLLLYMEKERLWHELSSEAEADRRSGKLDRLHDVIHEAWLKKSEVNLTQVWDNPADDVFNELLDK